MVTAVLVVQSSLELVGRSGIKPIPQFDNIRTIPRYAIIFSSCVDVIARVPSPLSRDFIVPINILSGWSMSEVICELTYLCVARDRGLV